MEQIENRILIEKALDAFEGYLAENHTVETNGEKANTKDGARIIGMTINSHSKKATLNAYMLTRPKKENDEPRGMDEAYFSFSEETGVTQL